MYQLLNISVFCHIIQFYWSSSSCCTFQLKIPSFDIEVSICVTFFSIPNSVSLLSSVILSQWNSSGYSSWTGCSRNPLAALIGTPLTTPSFLTNSLFFLLIFQVRLWFELTTPTWRSRKVASLCYIFFNQKLM